MRVDSTARPRSAGRVDRIGEIDRIDWILDEADAPPGGAVAWAGWVSTLLSRGPGVAAIVLYGSRLSAITATADSEPDFYVVVDSVRRYVRRIGAAALDVLLPPVVLHVSAPGGDGRAATAKVCVISTGSLRRQTAPDAPDLHHVGRFSKRVAVLFARDAAARAEVHAARRRSVERAADLALAGLPARFTLDEFSVEMLAVSYRAEPRIVEPDRARTLFSAHADRYRALSRALLRERGVVVALPGADGTRCRRLGPPPVVALETTLRRARSRERLRWPAYLITFDGWLDYLVRKLERRHGHRVALTPAQRRHPLILGWPVFLRLRRAGVVQ